MVCTYATEPESAWTWLVANALGDTTAACLAKHMSAHGKGPGCVPFLICTCAGEPESAWTWLVANALGGAHAARLAKQMSAHGKGPVPWGVALKL